MCCICQYVALLHILFDVHAKKASASRAYNEDTRDDIQALMLDTKKHLTLQGPNLIQDINNLDLKPNSPIPS